MVEICYCWLFARPVKTIPVNNQTTTHMKYEQRKKSKPYSETVKERFPNASPEFIARLIRIQRGEERL